MKKESIKPKPIEIMFEGLLKTQALHSKYLEKVIELEKKNLEKPIPFQKCDFKAYEPQITKTNSLWKWITIILLSLTLSGGLWIYQLLSDFQNIEKYYYLYELRRRYELSPDKAEKLYLEKEQIVKQKINK